MTASTRLERSGPAIRAALAEHAPDECAAFEAEFTGALAVAAHTFDLAPVEALLDRWWGTAVLRSDPPTDAEREVIARVRQGDFSGLLTRDDDGGWTRL